LRSILIILYIVCFGCYILFTRQPDYFDSEKDAGMIIEKNDSLVLQFSHDNKPHYAKIEYPFLYKAGQRKQVIYETADPSNARLYAVFGYWIRFGELIASIIIVLVLYYISVSITSNPTPEALMEELGMGKRKPRPPKYDA
jgi:hypothetical protein